MQQEYLADLADLAEQCQRPTLLIPQNTRSSLACTGYCVVSFLAERKPAPIPVTVDGTTPRVRKMAISALGPSTFLL
jgi:hypothetical protein